MTIVDEIEVKVDLSDTEKAIIEYIDKHLDDVPDWSSRELARRTYTSSTAVLRLIKKLGYKNYNDFKLHITSMLKNLSIGDLSIEGDEDFLLMVNKFTEIEQNVIQKTKEMISMGTLKNVCAIISEAKYIDIIANDANADIASYACHNFFYIGKIAKIYHYADAQLYSSMLADDSHVAIVVTKYGVTTIINTAAENFRKRGIPVIAFLNVGNKTYHEYDYVFYCERDDSLEKLGDLVFNISTKYLFDLIFSILFSQNFKETKTIEREHSKLFERK